jgi:uncharacterized membrane protein
MISIQNLILFVTILFSGLVAGLFYGYSCSVNIGLKSLSNGEYLRAMQSINVAIQNPVFFVCFMGLLVLFPLCLWISYLPYSDGIGLAFGFPMESSGGIPVVDESVFRSMKVFNLVLLGMVFYFVGVLGVTVVGNVPLNNQLAGFDLARASQEEMGVMRGLFEVVWNKFHLIRTVCAVCSFGCLVLAKFVG